jgi:hypothetical protein
LRRYAAQLRDEVGRQLKERGKKTKLDLAPLRASLAKLDQQIERGVGNLLLLDPANVPAAQRLLQEKRNRRDAIQTKIDAAGDQPNHRGQTTVERVLSRLERLGEQIGHADPAVAREAFRALFESVSLLWHPKTGRRYELARVAIHPKNSIRANAGNRT